MARYRQVDNTISCTYIVSFVPFGQKRIVSFACENREIRVFRARINIVLPSARMARYRQVDVTIVIAIVITRVIRAKKNRVFRAKKDR